MMNVLQDIFLTLGLAVVASLAIGAAVIALKAAARRGDHSIQVTCDICSTRMSDEWICYLWQYKHGREGQIDVLDSAIVLTLCQSCAAQLDELSTHKIIIDAIRAATEQKT